VLRPGDDEAQKEYDVERILDSKVRKQRGRVKPGMARRTRVEYLVQWKGHPETTWERQENLRGAPELVADYYNRAPAGTEPMPDELKSLLSIQDESTSAQLFPTAPGVQLHYIHGARAQSLYPSNRGRTAYATINAAGQQHSTVGAHSQLPYDGSDYLAPTLVDPCAPSLAASSPTADQRVHAADADDHDDHDDGRALEDAWEDDLEDDEAFAHAASAMQLVKARWNSPV
jgi:hypothetical protein